MKHYTRVLARVDLDAVEYNIEMMKKNIQKDTQMMAVIKMDGYGHGCRSDCKASGTQGLYLGLCSSYAG